MITSSVLLLRVKGVNQSDAIIIIYTLIARPSKPDSIPRSGGTCPPYTVSEGGTHFIATAMWWAGERKGMQVMVKDIPLISVHVCTEGGCTG